MRVLPSRSVFVEDVDGLFEKLFGDASLSLTVEPLFVPGVGLEEAY